MCKMFVCVFVIVSLLTASANARVVNDFSNTICRTAVDNFMCADGSGCVFLDARCDGKRDCDDGSDETLCPNTQGFEEENNVLHRDRRQASTCKRSEWQCRDGTCISFDGKCDGAVDCPDRSDETQPLCRNMPCQGNWFRCTYGACVDGTAPCNGVSDCADNSDELLPRCTNQTMEVRGKFKCKDGTTIDSSNLCDGKTDCPDGSDEVIESCADHACPSYLFQCAYGACVDQGSDCDGKQDCADGSDESDELCNRIGKPSTGGSGTVRPPKPRPGTCVLPPYPDHGTYSVANMPNASPGQSSQSYVLKFSCYSGYGIQGADDSGTLEVYCVNGDWYRQIPQCVRFCRLLPDPSVEYMCEVPDIGFKPCGTNVPPGTNVKPICNSPNYYSPDALGFMKCIDGSFDRVKTCKPECGRVTPESIQLAAGGTFAKRGEIPWHVGIYKTTYSPYKQICGGSLVSNGVVISAAHCFWSDATKKLPASDYAAAAGKLYRPWSDSMDRDAQKSDVSDIHIPSKFLGGQANFQEDIAIVILVTPFVYKTYVRPVCLNFNSEFEKTQLVPDHFGKVAGWGLTSAEGKPSQVLKVVEMPYVSDEVCIRTVPPSFRELITGDKFCAGYTNGTALCQGDSGGGLAFATRELGVERYYLQGVVSTAPSTETACNVHTFTAFTKVTKHDDLIQKYI